MGATSPTRVGERGVQAERVQGAVVGFASARSSCYTCPRLALLRFPRSYRGKGQAAIISSFGVVGSIQQSASRILVIRLALCCKACYSDCRRENRAEYFGGKYAGKDSCRVLHLRQRGAARVFHLRIKMHSKNLYPARQKRRHCNGIGKLIKHAR